MSKLFLNITFLFVATISSRVDSFAQTEAYYYDKESYFDYKINDSTIWLSNNKFIPICKANQYLSFWGSVVKGEKISISIPAVKYLAIHGNISYDFFYRSKLDTPMLQNDFQQHTERINLNILVKDKYPINVNLIARQSNSPFFRNYLDMNFQFDKYKYQKKLKQELINALIKELPQIPELETNKTVLKSLSNKYFELKNWLSSDAVIQKIIEEKERIYLDSLNASANFNKSTTDNTIYPKLKNAINFDSLFLVIEKAMRTKTGLPKENKQLRNSMDPIYNKSSFASFYNQKKEELEKLETTIKRAQKISDSVKTTVHQKLALAKQKVYNAKDEVELNQIAKEYDIKPKGKEKIEKLLSGVKSIGIGRSMLNYSELTAQNITVSGINIEYNPSYYVAFAAGKLDYRFRDFFNRSVDQNTGNNQYLLMGRYGIGNKDKKALIFSYFQGRKSTSQYGFNDTVSSLINIMGYSLEAIWKKDENNFLSAEVAKSTRPISGNLLKNREVNSLFNWNRNSNLGYNFKFETLVKQTKTRLSGFYRATGQDFQSFSLFTYNTNQKAWLIKGEQPFLKNKINLTAMLRQNDFTNPFTVQTFNTNTTFKTLMLNVRVPKYPSISLGYYPATQLYAIDNQTIRENAYYIVNGTLTHNYFHKGVRLNTTVVYNQFINNATDSGFIYYKGVNYLISQTIILKKLQLKEDYSYSKQPELSFYTLESSADYALKSFLKVGGGVKYNKVQNGEVYMGSRALLYFNMNKLGVVQMQYEKSFIPTLNNVLFPIDMGRLTWSLNF